MRELQSHKCKDLSSRKQGSQCRFPPTQVFTNVYIALFLLALCYGNMAAGLSLHHDVRGRGTLIENLSLVQCSRQTMFCSIPFHVVSMSVYLSLTEQHCSLLAVQLQFNYTTKQFIVKMVNEHSCEHCG